MQSIVLLWYYYVGAGRYNSLMQVNYKYIIAIVIGIILGVFLCNYFHEEPVKDYSKEAELYTIINIQSETIKSKNKHIAALSDSIIHLKEKKAKIIYRTKFDTLATIDTVYIELIKCDSIVQIDAKIITGQDSLIYDLGQVIKAYDTINVAQKQIIIEGEKAHKKEVRKLKTTHKIKGAIIIALNVASIASPSTAIITSGLSVLVAILPIKSRKKP
jgi:hypothetical protein